MKTGLLYIRASLKTLRTNILRSILTAIGISFGVASVIAMLSIGEGAKKEVIKQIKSLGLNNIIIENYFDNNTDNKSDGSNKDFGLTQKDYEVLHLILPNCSVIADISTIKKCLINKTFSDIKIMGISNNWQKNKKIEVDLGRNLYVKNSRYYEKICVINEDISKKYFTELNPIGKELRIDKEWYKIVGIVPNKKILTFDKKTFLTEEKQMIYIPIKTFFKFEQNGEQLLNRITVSLKDKRYLSSITTIINRALIRLHDKNKDFKVIIPEKLLEKEERINNIFDLIMGAIASISLLVGGIGIMNIMLANVMERKHEIGIRRALGASKKSILLQFLHEASMISFIGGIFGILGGIILTYIISFYANWDADISFSAIIISFSVAILTGIIFGIMPAKKAANMDPIDALRYE